MSKIKNQSNLVSDEQVLAVTGWTQDYWNNRIDEIQREITRDRVVERASKNYRRHATRKHPDVIIHRETGKGHSGAPVLRDQRNPTTFCALCEGWFAPEAEAPATPQPHTHYSKFTVIDDFSPSPTKWFIDALVQDTQDTGKAASTTIAMLYTKEHAEQIAKLLNKYGLDDVGGDSRKNVAAPAAALPNKPVVKHVNGLDEHGVSHQYCPYFRVVLFPHGQDIDVSYVSTHYNGTAADMELARQRAELIADAIWSAAVKIDTDGEITCKCGNTSGDEGFETCDPQGIFIHPTAEQGWDGHYICGRCHLVIDTKTGKEAA